MMTESCDDYEHVQTGDGMQEGTIVSDDKRIEREIPGATKSLKFEMQRTLYERYAAWLREAQDLYRHCLDHGIVVPPYLGEMINAKSDVRS